MPPTVKANEPVIDYAGMANLNLYLCLFCFAIRIFTNQLPALIVRIDNAMNKLTKFPDLGKIAKRTRSHESTAQRSHECRTLGSYPHTDSIAGTTLYQKVYVKTAFFHFRYYRRTRSYAEEENNDS